MTHTSDKHFTDEELELVARGKADGIYMKAPNGSPTSLNRRQLQGLSMTMASLWLSTMEHRCAETRLLPRGDGRGTGSLIYPKRLRSTHSRAVNIPA